MPANTRKPLLLVDVDGVLSLFPVAPATPPEGTWLNVDGIVHLISAAAARHLRDLASSFELVWCTGWEEKANDHLPRALGLEGPLPHLTFPPAEPGGARRHWKLAAVQDRVGDERPVAWVDDDLDESCEEWASHRRAPTLLVRTEAHAGLTAREADELRAWVRSLATPAAG